MIIGDEYAIILAAAGALPPQLKNEPLMTVPAAVARLKRSPERARRGAALGHGRIARLLSSLPPDAANAIIDPEVGLYGVATRAQIGRHVEMAKQEAATLGIPLGEYAAQFAGAAKRFESDIWVGYDRNIPRWAQEGIILEGVRWRRIRDLHQLPPTDPR